MVVKYKCGLCGNSIKKLFKNTDSEGNPIKPNIAPFLECSCGGVMEKELPEFAVASFEVIDNGFMTKKVELRKDAKQKRLEKGENYIKTMEGRDRIVKKED